jgi:ERCC4-type nuclease
MDRLEIAYSRLVPTDPEIFQPDTHHPPEYLTGDWQVVLYVDKKERNNATVMNTQEWVYELNSRMRDQYHQEQRTHVELTSLAAGDYLWVAKRGTEVRVLDYCVERKTTTDLKRCLTTMSQTYPKIVKMGHQMRQLRYSGISNPVILVEGTVAATCVQTVCRQLRNGERPGFSLEETNNLRGTQTWLLQHHDMIRREMRVARPKTLSELRTSVTKAMECPKFKFYNSLLRLDGVGETTAFRVVEKYSTEASLRQTLTLNPNDINIPTEGARVEKISKLAAANIQLKFGSHTMVPAAAARMPPVASIPPASQSNRRSFASTTTRPRSPSRTSWAGSQSNKRSPAAASLGSFQKKRRVSTPLRTASITPVSMAPPSNSSTIDVDYEEPRFEDFSQSEIRAATRNSLQKEPTFEDRLQTGIINSLQEHNSLHQEPSFDDEDMKDAMRNSLLKR